MHPLAVNLDTSDHRQKHFPCPKRRTSLDNSCLSDHESLRMLVNSDQAFDVEKPRRYSLNNNAMITATFLADMSSGHKKQLDLDLDWHSSEHDAIVAQAMVLDEEISITDGSFIGSDCDSFCDASVQEQANTEYLEKDLGASIMNFSSMGSVGLGGDLEVPMMISEEMDEIPASPQRVPITVANARGTPPQRSVARVVSAETQGTIEAA